MNGAADIARVEHKYDPDGHGLGVVLAHAPNNREWVAWHAEQIPPGLRWQHAHLEPAADLKRVA